MSLTEYRYRGFGLNDGVNYFMGFADNASLDDRPEASVTFAQRGAQEPVITGFALTEATLNLNISIKANTPQDFASKLDALVRLFDTTDPTLYKLERRRPWEQYFRYLMVAPRALSPNRPERKVSITLYSTSRTWLSSDESIHINEALFGGPNNLLYAPAIVYDGFAPVEPIIEITALSAGSVGNRPIFSRPVEVWTNGAHKAVGYPILAVQGWNTTPEVGSGSTPGIRADGADITVTLARTGEEIPRWIAGTTASRRVWINPRSWPSYGKPWLNSKEEWGIGSFMQGLALKSTDTVAVVAAGEGNLDNFPQSGRMRVGSEIMIYAVAQYLNTERTSALLNLNRGVEGTVAQNHPTFTRAALPELLYINYGYSDDYQGLFAYDTSNWPRLDYNTSTNQEWVLTSEAATQDPYAWRMAEDMLAPVGISEKLVGDRPAGSPWPRLIATKPTPAGGIPFWTKHRYLAPNLPNGTRRVDAIRCVYAAAPIGAAGGVDVYLVKTVGNFGVRNQEGRRQLYHHFSDLTPETVDTGWVPTRNREEHGSHFSISLGYVPLTFGAVDVPVFTLQSIRYQMDSELAEWVSAGPLGANVLGRFPMQLWFRNQSDAANQGIFGLSTRLAVGETVTIDCGAMTITNTGPAIPLTDSSYTLPVWMRLLPGTNNIHFAAPPGAATYRLRVRWRTRY